MHNSKLSLDNIPGPVVSLATALGIRIDGIWPATKRTPEMLNCTSLRENCCDPDGVAIGASFCVRLDGVSYFSFLAAYSEVLSRFMESHAAERVTDLFDADLIRASRPSDVALVA